jgi:hypothetical protein
MSHSITQTPIDPSAPTPVWSPRNTAEPPTIDEPANPTKHDSPHRPDGKHDLGDTADEHTSPLVVEDPKPEAENADPAEDDSSRNARLVAGPPAIPAGLTPSGRPMRPTSEEAYY